MRYARLVASIVALVGLTVTPQLAAEQSGELKPAEFEVKLRGYFLAASDMEDESALGGYAKSDNASRPIEGNLEAPRSGVYLQVLPDETRAFAETYRGMTVRLVNGTDEPVWFSASDSRLDIVQEAEDAEGRWRAIEYLPSSRCGNSYHRVGLKPGRYWTFAAPRYEGPFETRIRVRLRRDDEKDLVSDPFDGSIHRSQFTEKQKHRRGGVMDPYPVVGD